jgi:hypothetical protein
MDFCSEAVGSNPDRDTSYSYNFEWFFAISPVKFWCNTAIRRHILPSQKKYSFSFTTHPTKHAKQHCKWKTKNTEIRIFIFLKVNSGISRNVTLLFCIVVRYLIPQMRNRAIFNLTNYCFIRTHATVVIRNALLLVQFVLAWN